MLITTNIDNREKFFWNNVNNRENFSLITVKIFFEKNVDNREKFLLKTTKKIFEKKTFIGAKTFSFITVKFVSKVWPSRLLSRFSVTSIRSDRKGPTKNKVTSQNKDIRKTRTYGNLGNLGNFTKTTPSPAPKPRTKALSWKYGKGGSLIALNFSKTNDKSLPLPRWIN